MAASTSQGESGVMIGVSLGIQIHNRNPGRRLGRVGRAILSAWKVVAGVVAISKHSSTLLHLLLLLLELLLLLLLNSCLLLLKRGGSDFLLARLLLVSELLKWWLLETKSQVAPILQKCVQNKSQICSANIFKPEQVEVHSQDLQRLRPQHWIPPVRASLAHMDDQ